jgi:hypothetical protein
MGLSGNPAGCLARLSEFADFASRRVSLPSPGRAAKMGKFRRFKRKLFGN